MCVFFKKTHEFKNKINHIFYTDIIIKLIYLHGLNYRCNTKNNMTK